MKDPKKYVRKSILALSPYSTARDDFAGGDISIWLDANESPYNHTTQGRFYDINLNRYPDPHQKELKLQIGRLKGIAPECIFLGGAGSDEAIDLVYRVFCTPGVDNVVAMDPSYGVYSVAAAINDVEYRRAPLASDFSLDIDALLEACDSNTKVIWICSPNNPTGNAFDTASLLSLCDKFDGIVVVDEAYIDFSDKGSMLQYVGKVTNLIVLQTFSKAWGMASLRLGMAFADPEIASIMGMVKYPYNVNGPTQLEVAKQIARDISVQVSEIKRERQRLTDAFGAMPHVVEHVYPSDANSLLVKVADANAVYDYLMRHGILVRNRTRLKGCENCLRITVGTPAENSRLIETLAAYPKAEGVSPMSEMSMHNMYERKSEVERCTSETSIHVKVDLDNQSMCQIHTGIGFFDHMLSQIPHHGGIGLSISCVGDLQVDEHHTIEDVAIALGTAIIQALGDKVGIDRYGFVLPMDESRAMVLLDFGGRDELIWDVHFTREYLGDMPTEMFKHFFKSLASAMRANIHIKTEGENNHHLAESIFKAFARAMRMAVRRDPFCYYLPSSKGIL